LLLFAQCETCSDPFYDIAAAETNEKRFNQTNNARMTSVDGGHARGIEFASVPSRMAGTWRLKPPARVAMRTISIESSESGLKMTRKKY
jgi:hypothetical protein